MHKWISAYQLLRLYDHLRYRNFPTNKKTPIFHRARISAHARTRFENCRHILGTLRATVRI